MKQERILIMVDTIVIDFNKEDLKVIKVGINKLYELLNNKVIGDKYNEKYAWTYELYNYIYEHLKFDLIK